MKPYDKIPNILIIGDKRLKETELENLTKNEIGEMRVFYLSAIDGIDMETFKKASIPYCRAVYFIGHLNLEFSSNAYI